MGAGAAVGGVAGAVIGLIFPPALLVSAAVGAGIGAGAGATVKQLERRQVKADIEETLPPGTSGIVVLFEERWVTEIEGALPKAVKPDSTTSRRELALGALDQVVQRQPEQELAAVLGRPSRSCSAPEVHVERLDVLARHRRTARSTCSSSATTTLSPRRRPSTISEDELTNRYATRGPDALEVGARYHPDLVLRTAAGPGPKALVSRERRVVGFAAAVLDPTVGARAEACDQAVPVWL